MDGGRRLGVRAGGGAEGETGNRRLARQPKAVDGEGRQGFSIQLTQGRGFGELDGAEVDGFDGFAGVEVSAVGGKLGEDGSVGEQRFAVWKSSGVRAEGFEFAGGDDADDVRRGCFGLVCFSEIPSGVVIFVALGVDEEMGFAALAFGSCSGGEDFSALDWEEVGVAGELPALGGGDGAADAGVAAGADAEGEGFDVGRVEVGFF